MHSKSFGRTRLIGVALLLAISILAMAAVGWAAANWAAVNYGAVGPCHLTVICSPGARKPVCA